VVIPIESNHFQEIIHKYQVNGPRYTSYPTAREFNDHFSEQDYYTQAKTSNQFMVPKSLSAYIHIPFCNSLCYYCGCNKVISRKEGVAEDYLEYLYKEIKLQASLFEGGRLLEQIHLGGGTPTYLTSSQLAELLGVLVQHFHLALPNSLELGIEIDPRTVSDQSIKEITDLGFNRISIGVQDFDTEVQKAINRVQSKKQVISTIDAFRRNGVKSVSLDIIYGLPKQTVESFGRTIDEVIDIKPSRIALYHYAHMPKLISSQRLIDEKSMPTSMDKITMFSESVVRLMNAGYIYIGMDHFALPEDSLAKALTNGGLQRNFQGYSTHAACDIIGFGVSAISSVNNAYCQNTKSISTYKKILDNKQLPIVKGITLKDDDLVRAAVLQQIMCQGKVDYEVFNKRYHIDFKDYFTAEIEALTAFASDELVQLDHSGFTVTDQGRFFLRNISMIFDVYLPKIDLQPVKDSPYSMTL